jgi:hypothetical protein
MVATMRWLRRKAATPDDAAKINGVVMETCNVDDYLHLRIRSTNPLSPLTIDSCTFRHMDRPVLGHDELGDYVVFKLLGPCAEDCCDHDGSDIEPI